MNSEQLELLVFSAMKTELKSVVNLGALIGFLLGLFNLLHACGLTSFYSESNRSSCKESPGSKNFRRKPPPPTEAGVFCGIAVLFTAPHIRIGERSSMRFYASIWKASYSDALSG